MVIMPCATAALLLPRQLYVRQSSPGRVSKFQRRYLFTEVVPGSPLACAGAAASRTPGAYMKRRSPAASPPRAHRLPAKIHRPSTTNRVGTDRMLLTAGSPPSGVYAGGLKPSKPVTGGSGRPRLRSPAPGFCGGFRQTATLLLRISGSPPIPLTLEVTGFLEVDSVTVPTAPKTDNRLSRSDDTGRKVAA